MFIDDLFSTFYEKCPPTECEFGHIYKTPCYYPHENLEFWRPVPTAAEAAISQASRFIIRAAGQDQFSHNFPLAKPKLESNEEFIVVRAKPRPVVLLLPQFPIEGGEAPGFRGKVWRRRCLVAQRFGLEDAQSGKAEFSPTFVDRVRKLEFPQLMFSPSHPGLFDIPGIFRIDECQSVFVPHLSPTGFKLSDDAVGLLRSQLSFLLTNEYTGDFKFYRDELFP